MDNFKVKAHRYHAQLDKELSQYPRLNQFQAATGVPKTYLALGTGVFFFVMIFFNLAGKLLSNLLGWIYPAYRSFKALESPVAEDDKQCGFATKHYVVLTPVVDAMIFIFEVVYGFVAIIESFTDVLLYWFPFYFLLKTLFLLWLMIPSFNGAVIIYTRILRPFLTEHHGKIDGAFKDYD
ncbi:ER membrane protein DP1/Yop1 [Modicella reniformis]|uniref:Protein YOP1 n=1 Tax=Modicella reniformis TaxID=1440133 RepID=A0A9P6M8S1_9FUNG|nr:ER membrane protein DP1/Yop1 [Modicella reniformis]